MVYLDEAVCVACIPSAGSRNTRVHVFCHHPRFSTNTIFTNRFAHLSRRSLMRSDFHATFLRAASSLVLLQSIGALPTMKFCVEE